MQENEFEKKLQQKLEELKVQPADEVWLKIQAEVTRKTRRRRRVLFFFLVAVLFTAGFIIKETTTWFNTTTPVAAVQQQENKTTKSPGEKRDANNTSSSSAVSDNQPTVAITTDDNHSAKITTVNADAGNTLLVSQIKKQQGTLSLNITAGSFESQQSDVSPATANHSYKKIKDKTNASVKTTISGAAAGEEVIETVEPSLASTTEMPITKETNAATVTNEPVQQGLLVNKVIAIDSVKKDIKTTDPQNKLTGKSNKKLWSVRLLFAAGMSATGNSYLSNKSFAQADYTAANPGNVPSAGNLFLPPSSVKNGYGIEAGINVYRRLSAKSKIAAGLSYQLHTTGIQIGSRSDSAAALRQNVFANGSQQSYTNYYHLISVPVQFSTQLFTIGGADVNLDLGASFSRLISTNSLQYNLGRLVYYQDNSLFNKNIIGLSAGANIHLFPKTKAGFYIGPEFYYSLTPMASAGMYEKSHYQFIGIRLQKNLKK
jgi:hypothetical protein